MAPEAAPRLRTIDELRLWQRFHLRLSLLYGAAVLLVLAALGGSLYRFGMETELRGLQSRLRAEVTALAATLDADLLATVRAPEDQEQPGFQEARRLVEAVAEAEPEMSSIYVLLSDGSPTQLRFALDVDAENPPVAAGTAYDASDIPVMQQGLQAVAVEDRPYEDEYGTTLSGYAPLIASDGRRVGLVGIDVDASRLTRMRLRVLGFMAWFFGLSLLLLVPLAMLVGHLVRNPIERVIGGSGAIAEGRFDTRLHLRRRDEFGLMASHFDVMAEGLEERERIRTTFGRYLGKEVARTLLRQGAATLGGEERVVTILFVDLRRYSTLTEHLSATQVVELLNTYLGAMTPLLEREGGVLLEFLGDGFLAIFGAPTETPDHPERGLRCALALRERLVELNRQWEETGLARLWQDRGIPHLEARAGLHTGPVVAGNLGSPDQMKYSVVGDSVNVAARLEALNRELGTDILVSEELHARLSPDLAARGKHHGAHHVKGRDQAVDVYSY